MRKLLATYGYASPPPPPTPVPCSPPPPPCPPTSPYSNAPPPNTPPNHNSPPPGSPFSPPQQPATPPSQPNAPPGPPPSQSITPPGPPPSQTFTPPPSQPVTPPSQPAVPPFSPPTHVSPPPNYYSPPHIPGGPPDSPFMPPLTPYTPNTPYIPPPPSTHHHRTIIITACSVGGFFFLAFLLAALLCCKKKYRKHDEECETVETVEAVGAAEVVGASVPVHGAYGQAQEEVNVSEIVEGSYDHTGPRPPYGNEGEYSSLDSKGRNSNGSSSEQKNSRHARENIPKVKDQGDEMKKPKAEKSRGRMTRQKALGRSNPERCARSNNSRCMNSSTRKDSRKKMPKADTRLNKPVFEVGECSRTKDDSGRVIEEESEEDEPEELEMVSEHEMLRKIKKKLKGKEKVYRDRVYSEHQTERVLEKKDMKDKLQTALTAAEKKKTKL